MKGLRILAMSFALALSACGYDNNNTETAQVPGPEYGQTCVQNGGYGCVTTQQYPAGFYAYPMNNNYYYGYNNGAYSGFNGCSYYYGYGYQTFYHASYGLGCVQVQPSYYTYNVRPAYYNYGGYNAYRYCTPGTVCANGTQCITCSTSAAVGFCAQ
jgi:hypothetical protein